MAAQWVHGQDPVTLAIHKAAYFNMSLDGQGTTSLQNAELSITPHLHSSAVQCDMVKIAPFLQKHSEDKDLQRPEVLHGSSGSALTVATVNVNTSDNSSGGSYEDHRIEC